MTTLRIAQSIAVTITLLWATAAVIISLAKQLTGRDAPDAAYTLFYELKPFYLPAVVVAYVLDYMRDGMTGWNLTSLVFGVLNYWMLRNNGDDDRWKRRRKRLAERVQVSEGRLAVVVEGER